MFSCHDRNLALFSLEVVTVDRLPPQHCKAPPPFDVRKRNLTPDERRASVSMFLLLVQFDNPDLKKVHGVITSTASLFQLSWITIRRVCQRALAKFCNPGIQSFMSSPQKIGFANRNRTVMKFELRSNKSNWT